MYKQGFDNDKYIEMQSAHIRERIEMFGGKLYMSCDEENDMKRIFTLDVESGEVEVCFARNIGKGFEAEGLTVYADESGEPVICVLDRGERRKSSNLTFYDITF